MNNHSRCLIKRPKKLGLILMSTLLATKLVASAVSSLEQTLSQPPDNGIF